MTKKFGSGIKFKISLAEIGVRLDPSPVSSSQNGAELIGLMSSVYVNSTEKIRSGWFEWRLDFLAGLSIAPFIIVEWDLIETPL